VAHGQSVECPHSISESDEKRKERGEAKGVPGEADGKGPNPDAEDDEESFPKPESALSGRPARGMRRALDKRQVEEDEGEEEAEKLGVRGRGGVCERVRERRACISGWCRGVRNILETHSPNRGQLEEGMEEGIGIISWRSKVFLDENGWLTERAFRLDVSLENPAPGLVD
jgi:hypothetical protein